MPLGPRIGLALATLALLACSGASGPPAAPDDRLADGARMFQRHCAPCHGARADGDGPVAPHLLAPPADLTRIAARRGGFDADVIAAFIDGRDRAGAHGSPEMPVWGRALAEDRASIPLVVAYLKSIQVAPDVADAPATLARSCSEWNLSVQTALLEARVRLGGPGRVEVAGWTCGRVTDGPLVRIVFLRFRGVPAEVERAVVPVIFEDGRLVRDGWQLLESQPDRYGTHVNVREWGPPQWRTPPDWIVRRGEPPPDGHTLQ